MPIIGGKKSTSDITNMLAHNTAPATPIVQTQHYFKPERVNTDDLKENGKLHTDEQIKHILNLEPGKYKKGKDPELGDEFSAVVVSDFKGQKKHYSVYPGFIGKGGFGKVRLGQDVETGEWVALKFQKQSADSQNEYRVLSMIQQTTGKMAHPKLDKLTGEKLYEQDIIATPLIKGMTLADYLTKHKPQLSPYEWMELSLQILKAVKDLHNRVHYHNDIKLENFMIDPKTGKVTLFDFGLAVDATNSTSDIKGTPYTMAPEVLKIARNISDAPKIFTYNESSDIHQVGKVLALVLDLGKITNRPKSENVFYDEKGKVIPEKAVSDQGKKVLADFSWTVQLLEPSASLNKLQDPVLAKKMLQHIEDMSNDNPGKRPDLDSLIKSFQDLRDEQLKAAGIIKTTGFIDMNVYQKTDDEGKSAMIQTLYNFDQVILINNNLHTNPSDLLSLQLSLEVNNVKLIDTKYKAKDQNHVLTVDQIAKHIEDNQNQRIYEFYNVTHPSVAQSHNKTSRVGNMDATGDFSQQMAAHRENLLLQRQINLALTVLNDDLKRLDNKYPVKNEIVKDRIDAITKTIEKINNKSAEGGLKRVDLHEELRELQSKMTTTGSFKKQSHSASSIEELRTNLEKEAMPPQPGKAR